MMTDPPQPPQWQTRPDGRNAKVSGSVEAVADPEAQREAEHEVHAVGLLAEMRSTVDGESSETPSSVPPLATTAWMRATERALPCPFAAPISARRHAVVLATEASGAGR